MSVILVIAAFIIVFFIVVIFLVNRTFKAAEQSLTNWANEVSPWCTHNLDDPSCDFVTADMTIPTKFSDDAAFDKAEATFAVQLMSRFEAANGMHDVSYLTIPGLTFNSTIHDSPQDPPMVAIWTAGDIAFIACRGTITPNDWVRDIKYSQIKDAGVGIKCPAGFATVHSGFSSKYNNFRQALISKVTDIKPTIIFIVGHSLGSAISYMATLDLAPIGKVYTYAFAPPRTGDDAFAQCVEKTAANVHSIINIADMIPTMPFTWMPSEDNNGHNFQYAHVHNIHVFNFPLNDIFACHQLPAYYHGMNSGEVGDIARNTTAFPSS